MSASQILERERGRRGLWLPLLLCTLLGVPAGALRASTEIPRHEASRLAEQYLRSHRLALGLEERDVAEVVVTDAYVSSDSGVTHIYLRQRWEGIDVFAGNFTLNLDRDGRPFFVGDRFLRGLTQRIDSPAAPALTAREAVRRAAEHLELGEPVGLRILDAGNDPARMTRLTGGGISRREIPALLVWTEDEASGQLRLSWDIEIELLDGAHFWSARIDAENGTLLDLDDFVDYEQYRVYPIPYESPDHAPVPPPGDGRELVVDPYLHGSGSPYGWHDTDGAVGAESNSTKGNNSHAYPDRDGDGSGFPVVCGTPVSCDFALDLNLDPLSYENAAVTNLFYWVNVAHDVLYEYGFDEVAGNFQTNNYGHGGVAGDPVYAMAQASAAPTTGDAKFCNSNFLTPPDGTNGIMRMYLCNKTTPIRDGDLDSGVILHEYAHGLSRRLVGGPSSVSCLGNEEQMGEGWSDFVDLIVTARASDLGTDPRAHAAYERDLPQTGPGNRLAPYSTDLEIDPYTYGALAGMWEEHDIGFVWATMLWEMTWGLIDAHGFNPDIYDDWTTGGNNLALQLVVDGLALQSCRPGFVDGRDAILAADQALTGGENVCRIWRAFARRGLGYKSSQGSPEIAYDLVEAFDLPEECALLTSDPPERKICSGDNAIFDIDVHQGFAPPVTLSVPSPPGGVSVLFSDNPVASVLPATSTLTVFDTGGLAFGTQMLTIHGDDSSITDDLDLTLRSFTTWPGAPTPSSPADGAAQAPLRPLFRWLASFQGDEYLLEVDDDPGFGSPEVIEILSGTEFTPASALSPETTYYWRLEPSNPCGNGPASASWSFTTAPDGKILPPEPIQDAAFGTAVAIGDDLMAIGAPLENSAGQAETGAVYLYGRNAGGADAWSLISTFHYKGATGGEHFGAAVAIDADTLAVGAPGVNGGDGRVLIFERNRGGADAWGEAREITAPVGSLAGSSLALDGNFLVIGRPGSDWSGADSGLASVWDRRAGSWHFVTHLDPPIAHAGDRIGASVAISHGWIAVGAPGDDTAGPDAGRVLLFERNTGGAEHWGYRTARSPMNLLPDGLLYGTSVAMDLDTLLVGAPGTGDTLERGSVHVLEQNQGGADAWGEIQELGASDDFYWDAERRFGSAVALHGDLAIVGRSDSGEGGAVYLFENSATGAYPWVEVASAGAPDGPGGGYGNAVAIDDGTVVVGNQYDDPNGTAGAGSAYLIERSPTGFVQTTKVLGPSAYYGLGEAAAIDGGTMVASSYASGVDEELPIVYRRDATGQWSPVATLVPEFNADTESLCDFGHAVAVDGDFIVAGDPCFSHANDQADGAAFVFQRNEGGPDHWGEVKRLIASDQASYHSSRFGWSVAIDGDLIAIGDPWQDLDYAYPGEYNERGAVYLFRRDKSAADGKGWGQLLPFLDNGVYGNTFSFDDFGDSVALSGRHLLVGATRDEVDVGWGDDPGVGYLFEVIGNSTALKARLIAPSAASLDLLGWSSDLDGADAFLSTTNGSGVHVFSRNLNAPDDWGLRAEPLCDSPGPYNYCAESGAMDGGLILAGGTVDKLRAYRRNEGGADEWGNVTALDIVPAVAGLNNHFGKGQFDIDLDRGNAVVGASSDSENGSGAGAAYVFRLQGSWSVTPPNPPLIFRDGFESGNPSAWSSAVGLP